MTWIQENILRDSDFSLEEYLASIDEGGEEQKCDDVNFHNLCKMVEEEFNADFSDTDQVAQTMKLEREKKAIMGYSAEMQFYKERIKAILMEKKMQDADYPHWYSSLVEAIFAEVYGLSGLSPWVYDTEPMYRNSPSAKLIGDRLYCLIDGKSVLQEQTIGRECRNRLKRAMLMATPHQRLEYGFHEVFLRNGIRITIYSGHRTKENQEIMVLRKYLIQRGDFNTLVERKTISQGMAALFKLLVEMGINIVFVGQVRSGKTTMLQIWQSYEKQDLEGLALATDIETPWHNIMPDVPIMQLVADGKELEVMTKSLLRGDNDYILMEEMRDATAFKILMEIVATGTQRCKCTVHDNDGIGVPIKVATKIAEKYGVSCTEIVRQFYEHFDFAVELCQMDKDKSIKIVKGILAYGYNYADDTIEAAYICKYDFDKGNWIWNDYLPHGMESKFIQNGKEYTSLRTLLHNLSKGIVDQSMILNPAYYRS